MKTVEDTEKVTIPAADIADIRYINWHAAGGRPRQAPGREPARTVRHPLPCAGRGDGPGKGPVAHGGAILNIQIFGRSKCFDTKKAERYFKERRIRVQQIDLLRYGMSGGEFDSVLRAVGGVDKLIDWSRRDPDIDLLRYMDDVRAKEDKLFERPELMRTPVVRNGRKATVGYCPDVWKQWEESEK